MMKEIGDGLWVAECDFAMAGLEFGGKMSVVRLGDGGLLLYNVIAIDDELAESIAALGEVRHIIAPNSFHHLFLAAARGRYPEARVHVPPALEKKRPEHKGHVTLGPRTTDPLPWSEDLETLVIDGAPRMDEIILYHRASRTLILCDLVFHLLEVRSFFSRLFFRVLGVYGRVKQSPMWRWLLTRDRRAAAASLEAMWGWDIERVIVAHGPIIEGPDSKERLAAGMRWMCPPEERAHLLNAAGPDPVP